MKTPSTSTAPTSMQGRMTMAIPTPKLMGGIIQKNMSGPDMKGKGGTTSGGTMAGCTACGSATSAIPTPKKM